MREDELLPVVVYIHGGAFTSGGAPEYDMRGFVDVAGEKGLPLVAVTIQYRLGRLGFLQSVEVHEDGATNAGLLDQR